MWCTLRLWTVCCLVVSSLFAAPLLAESKDAEYSVDSREYKLLLNPSKFHPDTPSALATLWDGHLKRLIDDALGMKDHTHRYTGTFDVNQPKRRVIRFWDTVAPYQCTFKNHGYNLRERVELVDGQEQADGREVTLKLRDSDPVRVANTDMNSSDGDAKSKFEEDIVPLKGRNKQVYTVMYSSSTSKKLKGDGTLSKMGDVFDLYPKLNANLKEDGTYLGPNDAVAVVSDLSLYEEVYEGPSIDLGHVTADLSVSLWSTRNDNRPGAPLIAELSFKYKLGKKAKEAKKAANRADALFSKLQDLEWISATSDTKTNFVYDYARFCQGRLLLHAAEYTAFEGLSANPLVAPRGEKARRERPSADGR